ncbi:hypothetical protein KN815_24730 [Streptomyces sp. 4503]|uniref:Uncharacterized protein n=1 Tax=Streptomyces niphimycinicus TaxID=2842201 RepID=A0ABS6CJM6_9ACTN|nr:hypothetical protein [Streptomyces niphimycinicus]MBU3867146.1 hypothetical protein [Streptomyces niphimycinicus]
MVHSTSSDETAADTLARISRLEWIYIRGVYFPATRRVRDPRTWYPSFKAAIDGLTDKKRKGQVLTVGVLSDDSDEHVVGPDAWPGHAARRCCDAAAHHGADLGPDPPGRDGCRGGRRCPMTAHPARPREGLPVGLGRLQRPF